MPLKSTIKPYEMKLLKLTTMRDNPEFLMDHYRSFKPCLDEICKSNVDSDSFVTYIYNGNFLELNPTNAGIQTMTFIKGVSVEAMEEGLILTTDVHLVMHEWNFFSRISQNVIDSQIHPNHVRAVQRLIAEGCQLREDQKAQLISELSSKLSNFYEYGDIPHLATLVMASHSSEILTSLAFIPKGVAVLGGIRLTMFALDTLTDGKGSFVKLIKTTIYSVSFKTVFRTVGNLISKHSSCVAYCFTNVYLYFKSTSFLKAAMSPENVQKTIKNATDATFKAFKENMQVKVNNPGSINIMHNVKKILYNVTVISLQSFQIYLETKISAGAEQITKYWYGSQNFSKDTNPSKDENSSSKIKK